jgi:hypothetical protein
MKSIRTHQTPKIWFLGRNASMAKRYFSYLLRIWQTDELEAETWLASLENPATRQIIGFSNLEELFKFLQSRKAPPAGDNPPSEQLPQCSYPNLTTKEKSDEE